MGKNILPILKVIALVSSIIIALIAILYIADIFSGEYVKRLALKVMAVIGIISAVSITAIFLTGKKE
ncbi:MAG: hypothetical protein AB1498_12860 [bacterium]